jgi:hypothetical protein
MTLYARSDITAVGSTNGCGGHIRPEGEDHLVVDCAECEPHLLEYPYWAATPEEVPLTDAERKIVERQQHEIELQRVADARADREFLHRQRLEAQQEAAKSDEGDEKAAKTRGRKSSGASA